jgi:hypothetical protein
VIRAYHAQAEARTGLVQRQGVRAGDVIVTGGKVVASARRVTSMRPPTQINGSARRFQLPNASTLLATWSRRLCSWRTRPNRE